METKPVDRMDDTSNEDVIFIHKDDCSACPICWMNWDEMRDCNDVLALTPCKHMMRLKCIEGILLARSSIPCYGNCPMCRAEICLFDLKVQSSSCHEYCSDLKEYKVSFRDTYAEVNDLRVDSGLSRNNNFALAGQTVYTREGGVGVFSMHFPMSSSINEGGKPSSISRPYLSCAKIAKAKMDDGSPMPDIVYFDEECKWHEKSRTFHGTLRFDKNCNGASFRGSNYWKVVLQVSSDVRYICGGGFIKNIVKRGPLDGLWKVIWKKNNTSLEIEVKNNCFCAYGSDYEISFDEDKNPYFYWPGGSVKQKGSINDKVNGPAVNEAIIWEHNDSDTGQIIWMRQSIGSLENQIELFGGGSSVAVPRTSYLIRGEDKLSPSTIETGRLVEGTIWGNSFWQQGQWGSASYHFISESGTGLGLAYISYESPECAAWPSLDDGSPVPSRVPFTNVSWDARTRTFRGRIEWKKLYGTSWQGDAIWEYEMVFCEKFMVIVAGCVKASLSDSGDSMQTKNHFGNELIYINGKSDERLLAELTRDEASTILRRMLVSRSMENINCPFLNQLVEHGAQYHHILLMLFKVESNE